MLTKLHKSISIYPRIHSRSRPECNADGTSKHSVQIPGNDGCYPNEPAGSIPGADKSQQRQSK